MLHTFEDDFFVLKELRCYCGYLGIDNLEINKSKNNGFKCHGC